MVAVGIKQSEKMEPRFGLGLGLIGLRLRTAGIAVSSFRS